MSSARVRRVPDECDKNTTLAVRVVRPRRRRRRPNARTACARERVRACHTSGDRRGGGVPAVRSGAGRLPLRRPRGSENVSSRRRFFLLVGICCLFLFFLFYSSLFFLSVYCVLDYPPKSVDRNHPPPPGHGFSNDRRVFILNDPPAQ